MPSWFIRSTQLAVRYSETKTENLVRSLTFHFEGLNFSSESWNQSWRETSEFPFQVSNSRSQDLGNTHTQSSKLQHKVSKLGGTHEPFWP